MKTLTKHRELIYNDLQIRRDHPTAKMVFDTAKNNVSKISFATVYNSLEYLVNQGMLKKVNINSDSARYDAVLEPHSHLICQTCGSIKDIPAMQLADMSPIQSEDFQISDVIVNIIGYCKNCDNK
ncbi:Fur family transcriptional regulator [Leptospira sp. GIMC2001]|uniref:Fur family transcriptional regulator n=1 Tax=Leptospira sp. GIMC2001 TaxID=1513297 RepID=UPI00234BE59E|nr:transcriptional repressor [Leptospira sp. GIMC2001]WCL50473.1 transcriptional repressor [Leptospira sp. GIMC2001]